jgi:hypothetical protein
MKKIIFFLILQVTLFAQTDMMKRFSLGVDTAVNVAGSESFGTSYPVKDVVDFKVKNSLSLKLGYDINDLIRAQINYDMYKNKNYKDLNKAYLSFVLTARKSLSTKELFSTDFMIYPSVEFGILGVWTGSASLNYEFSKHMEFSIMEKYLDMNGIRFGGGSKYIKGTFVGFRYKL